MVSFIISLVALVLGYLLYGKFVAHVFGPDDRPTPAVTKADGVDFMVLPSWKIFMIQFLNIAGTGPIFGAIMGAWYGPVAYLWIIFGCIFAGAMHDYMSGMLSLRNEGAGLPELVGKYLGGNTKKVMLVFSVLLLMMVGAVFVYSPAIILNGICDTSNFWGSQMFWIVVIFVYYIIATLLPIDKIIGKVYPLFAFSLLFMAGALMVGLFVKWPSLPELWSNLQACNLNENPAWLGTEPFMQKSPLFPCLFITIACGAISGFHATQSPLMARCIKHEKMGRPIFYGAMITEGIVALVWATVSMWFFYDAPSPGYEQIAEASSSAYSTSAPMVVKLVCHDWLGTFGGILAMLGVVAAPITSGDTALRSARLIIAQAIKLDQKPIAHRLYICIPLFVVAFLALLWQIDNPDGFNTVWQYFGWGNQTLSIFTLWTITVYLALHKKAFIITLIPALFMTAVCTSFIVVSPIALGRPAYVGYIVGGLAVLISLLWFIRWQKRLKNNIGQ